MEEQSIKTENLTTETAQSVVHEGGGVAATILNSNVINVIIVIAIVVWIIKKFNVLSLMSKARNEILEVIHNVKEERRVKQNALEQTKKNVQNSDNEVAKMLEDGEEVAKTLSDRIIKNAEQEAADLHKKAELSVESESQMAANRIMKTLTGSAFIIAEEHIKNTIDEARHRKYIDDFIGKLDNLQV